MSSTTASQARTDSSVTTTTTTTTPTPNPSATTSARWQRRLQLRELNLAAWAESSREPDNQARLDTSLKRHTTLLTRLRSSIHTTATVPAILNEIGALSLDKYVEEAVGATFEGLAKCKTGPETWAAIEVVSALHQRFPHTFTPPLVNLILTSLAPSTPSAANDREVREKEDTQRITKQRGLLRLLGELEVVGIVGKGSSTGSGKTLSVNSGMVGEITWKIIKEWASLTSDKEQLSLVAPLAIAFAKHLGPLYLPPLPTTADEGAASALLVNAHEFPALSSSKDDTESSSLVPREMMDKFRKLLVAYLDALGRKEVRNHLELQKQDKRNHEAYIRSGEVFEDREKAYERNVKNWERGWSGVTQLSELLGVAAPVLPSLTSTLAASSIVGTGTSSFQQEEEIGGPGSIWIDEEDKKFYEDLRELKGAVPGKFLGLGDKEVEATAAEEEKEKEELKMDVENETSDEPESTGADETRSAEQHAGVETEVDATLATGPAAQLTALFARLVDASSRSSIDDIAIEFAFLNSKAARKRLVKHLASINRNRQDLIPYYARLVGTLNPYMPDVGKELITILEEEFRYLQRKRQVDLAETRSKNLRFFSELTKFKITPIHSILHVFKVLLDDFTGANIDNFCTVLEGCGRFLLRSEATSERMRLVLETYMRKKAAMHLDQRQITMLENAYYQVSALIPHSRARFQVEADLSPLQCDPPGRPAIPPKERTPMQLYIRHLIYHQMTRNNVDKIAKLLRKLHWEDPAIVAKLHSAFTKVGKIKFSNIYLFAVLLDELVKFHSEFVVGVIDEVMENLRLGMEVNNFKYNQQRIATIKYLGEMYNYRVIESRVIFDTLWSLITFGHPQGHAHPATPSAIDMADDSFRIRLICVLLDTCGECFDRGQSRKKLDTFLIFFQTYVFTKRGIPMDVGFMVDDLFEKLRPKTNRFGSWEEAEKVASELRNQVGVAVNGANGGSGKGGKIEGAIVEEDEDEDEEEEPRRMDVDSDAGKKSGDESSGSDDGSEDGSNDNQGESSDDDDDDDDDDDSDEHSVEEDEDVEGAARPKDPNAMTEEEKDEFTRDLAKMMAGTGGSAGGGAEVRNKPVLFDVGVPFVRKTAPRGGRIEEDEDIDREEATPKGITFTLLTKKGNKQQTRSMEIPLESSIAVHTLEKRAIDKAEQQQLKQLVLDYEQREEVAEKQAFKDDMARRGIALKFKVVP
ncbi:BZ3500_MvSof-1268-A1-R1_Chr11-3g03587 [Microbotryum saponariae]|uniref:BZ3500_MvSof-1268-A1-R1_Chr11-3g03587 protein n=1 Tax=Microbotryum saponariae TaxID=289078 RepID=A0A2X0NE41_9BASI|nr:BZ3500_MvSof-1268-A1-R1_Chr11-3g03587 [Microbotryum saponariae]SDA03596.1 BZ3501_MvSof-1269-A2-R1_Chr11g03164 [Microbotryum saponariae]